VKHKKIIGFFKKFLICNFHIYMRINYFGEKYLTAITVNSTRASVAQ